MTLCKNLERIPKTSCGTNTMDLVLSLADKAMKRPSYTASTNKANAKFPTNFALLCRNPIEFRDHVMLISAVRYHLNGSQQDGLNVVKVAVTPAIEKEESIVNVKIAMDIYKKFPIVFATKKPSPKNPAQKKAVITKNANGELANGRLAPELVVRGNDQDWFSASFQATDAPFDDRQVQKPAIWEDARMTQIQVQMVRNKVRVVPLMAVSSVMEIQIIVMLKGIVIFVVRRVLIIILRLRALISRKKNPKNNIMLFTCNCCITKLHYFI